MRITLVSIHPAPSPQSLPLANLFLKAFAASTKMDIDLVDFFISQPEDFDIKKIIANNPIAVGFSIYLWNREASLEMVSQLRNAIPDCLLFAGGPEVTADTFGILYNSDLNFVIKGEGELPFAALCSQLLKGEPIDNIAGLILRGSEEPASSALQLENLDEIPSPYLKELVDCSSNSGVLWQLSRGCSFACDFCFDARGSRHVRRFSLKRAKAELRYFIASGVSQVFVLDSTFNQDIKRAKKILRMIRELAPNIHFHFEVRSEFMDDELAELFADITCSLQIGLQSSDSKVLREVGRSFSRLDFVNKVNLLNESGATFGFDLIYGLPGDTIDGFCSSIDFAIALYPNHLDIFPLALLPGTALAGRSRQLQFDYLKTAPYTVFATPTFNKSDMAAASLLASAADIFYTRGKAVAWFNSLLHVLKVTPSAFLKSFGEWLRAVKGASLDERDWEDYAVWQLQRKFLEIKFSSEKLKRLLPIVFDLIDYHYHYATVLMSVSDKPSKKKLDKKELANSCLRLSSAVRLVKFNFEIFDILESGAPDIRHLANNLKQTGSYAIIYPGVDAVNTESVAQQYFQLLEAIGRGEKAGDILVVLEITESEAVDFINFALAEGIVIYRE